MAWRKEEASCQRDTQRAHCSAAPPAPGTSSIPKPTPHHVPPPPKSFLPSSPVAPEQPRDQFYLSKGKDNQEPSCGFRLMCSWAIAERGGLRISTACKCRGSAWPFRSRCRCASVCVLLKFVQGRMREEDGVREINILLYKLGPLFVPDLFITCTAAVQTGTAWFFLCLSLTPGRL